MTMAAGGGRVLPPPPKPRTSTRTGANPRGVAINPPPLSTVNDRQETALRASGGSDVVSGHGYGSAAANTYKQSPGYAKAVVSVFKAQPAKQQQAIVRGAQRTPTYEGRLVLNYLAQQRGASTGAGLGPATIVPSGELKRLTSAGFKLPAGAISFTHGLGKIIGNAGKDLYNLPSGTVEGLYGLSKDIVTGHEGNAFHMLVDPFVQLAEHPLKTFEAHPLNTALMFAGPKALLGRGVGGLARSGALGEDAAAAASTVRPPLHVGTIAGKASPITEERVYSGDVINKAFQVAGEKVARAKGRNPNLAKQAPRFLPEAAQQAMNVGSDAKIRRIADEMTSTRQQAGRAERAVTTRKVLHAGPPKNVRNIVTHILQGVIRKPETAVEDITKEINRLKAAQTGKRTAGEIANRKQVRDLTEALKHPEDIPKAFEAAAQIRKTINAQDAYLVQKGLLDEHQAMRSKLFPYAIAHMGAKYQHGIPAQFEGDQAVMPGLEHANGDKLTTTEILQHLEKNGVADPAYVGHFPNKVAAHRFYQAYKLARGTVARGKRTGAAFRGGAYDHSFEGLVGQVASRAESVTKASLHDKVITRLGVLKPQELRGAKENGMFTPAEARQFAYAAMHDDHGNPIPGSLELTPISAAPANVMGAVRDLQHPHELQNLLSVEIQALSHAIEDAASRTDSTRNVVLIPRVAAQRFAQQFQRTDGLLRTVGRATQQFRRTVLPYSTHWMTQIASEAGLRALIGGALDPRYLADGRRLMNRLETTEPGRAALMEMVNATFYNARDPLMIHNPNAGILSSAAHAFPPTRALIAAHNHYANTIGHAMYSLEHNARLMGLGKLAHQDVAAFTGSWKQAVRLQGDSIEQLARKLETNPALVARFGRQIDDTFGKYNKFSPKVRSAIQSIAPFLPWYLNAAKYVLWHLPAHHPVSSALLASLRQTINQDMKDGKQAPLGTYQMQELARITPFGIFTPESTKPSLAGAVQGQDLIPGAILPQFESAAYNYAGLNSFGEGPLKGPAGDVKARSGPALAAAAENALEAFLPAARYLREAGEGGRPSYGTSTILNPQLKPGGPKPGPGQVAKRIFNPFYGFERAKGVGPAYGAPASSGGFLLGGSSSGGGGYLVQPSAGAGGYLLP